MSFVPLPFIRMSATTPGVALGESVELGPIFPATGVYVGQTAVMEIRVEAAGTVGGNLTARSFVQRFTLRRDVAGFVYLTGTDTQHAWGDAAGASWTLTLSTGVGPTRLAVVFTTGSTTSAAVVTADIYYTVVPPPPPFPTPLIEWRADTLATIIGGGSSTWYSRQPFMTYELTSTDSLITQVTNWHNSLPGIGYAAAGFRSPPSGNPPIGTGPIPLTGTSLTLYMVLDYRDPSPGGSGPFKVFSLGIQNDDSNYNQEFIVYINDVGGPGANQPSIDVVDNDPSFLYTGEYSTDHPFGSVGQRADLAPSLLVVQTQRSSGHNVILNGTNLAGTTTNNRGTIPNFQTLAYNPQVVQLAGYSYVLSSVNFAIESPTYIGHVLIYNAYHDAATINVVSAALKAFWAI